MTQSLKEVRPVSTSEPIFPLSVEQYHEMIRIGVLTDDDPVELIEGVLVFHMPKNPPHRFVTIAIHEILAELLPSGWFTQVQEPITLEDGEPEPDVAVVRGKNRDYIDRHPGGADIAIVIEVSDSTLDRDQSMKLRSYARAGIPEYWIVNLRSRCVEVYTKPMTTSEHGYASREDYGESARLPLIVGQRLGDIEVKSILP